MSKSEWREKLAPPHEAVGGLYTTVLINWTLCVQKIHFCAAQGIGGLALATIFKNLCAVLAFPEARGGIWYSPHCPTTTLPPEMRPGGRVAGAKASSPCPSNSSVTSTIGHADINPFCRQRINGELTHPPRAPGTSGHSTTA